MYISYFQENAAETYPWISAEQLVRIQFGLERKVARLVNLKKYQIASFTSENEDELVKLRILRQACEEILSTGVELTENIVLLFIQCTCVPQDIRLKEYIDYLNFVLQHEESALPLLINLRIEDPLQFAGILIYLLNKSIDEIDIFHSGLLHLFFDVHSCNIDQVVEAYRIFSSSIQEEEPLYLKSRSLLKLVSEKGGATHPSLRYYGLDGKYYSSERHAINVEMPPLTFTISSENLQLLSAFLGPFFLFRVLQKYLINQNPLLYTFIMRTLETISTKWLLILLSDINTQLTEPQRGALLTQLGKFLHDESVDKLFETKGYEWIALVLRPTLLEKLSSSELRQLTSSPLRPQDVKSVLGFLNEPKLSPYLNQILRQMYDLFLQRPKLINGDLQLMNNMRSYTETTIWCLSEIITFREDLIKEVLQQGSPFTADSYRIIYDIYRTNKSKTELLIELSSQKLDYPQGNYELQTFMIRELFIGDIDFDLMSCLNGIHPVENYENYTLEERENAQCRTLYECLSAVDNVQLQTLIIELLTSCFGEYDWINAKPGCIPLIERALLNGNRALLLHYFPLNMTDLLRLDRLEMMEQELLTFQEKTLLQFVSSNFHAFTVALSLYPVDYSISPWLKTNAAGDTVLHYVARMYPNNLSQILASHPKNECFTQLMKKNNEGNTVLLEVIELKTFQALLPYYPKDQRLAIFLQKDDLDQTLFHNVIKYPVLLQAIFNSLTSDECMEVLKITLYSDESTLLQFSYTEAESFKIILECYPPDQRLKAVKDYDNLLRKGVIEGKSNIVEIILNALSADECIELIMEVFRNPISFYHQDEGTTLLHHSKVTPEVLLVFLKVLPKEYHLRILRAKNREGETPLQVHKRRLKVTDFQAILNELSEEHRFEIIVEKNKKGDTLLHSILSSPDNFQTVVNAMSKDQQLAAMKITNNLGDTVLHEACYNLEAIKSILALYPDPERLTAMMLPNIAGNTLLHLVVRSNWMVAPAVLRLYPEHVRLAALLLKNHQGQTVLHAADNLDANLAIIEALPKNQRVDALNAIDRNGNTILHIKNPPLYRSNFTDTFLALVLIYPMDQRADALKKKNDAGKNVLHEENFFLECDLKVILNALPQAHRFDVIADKNENDETILHLTAYHAPSVIIDIIESLPEDQRLPALRIENNQGITPLYLLEQETPNILAFILNALPDEERTMMLYSGALAHS